MKVYPEPGFHVCELLLLQLFSVRIKANPLLANPLSKTFRKSSDWKETQLGTKNNKTMSWEEKHGDNMGFQYVPAGKEAFPFSTVWSWFLAV